MIDHEATLQAWRLFYRWARTQEADSETLAAISSLTRRYRRVLDSYRRDFPGYDAYWDAARAARAVRDLATVRRRMHALQERLGVTGEALDRPLD